MVRVTIEVGNTADRFAVVVQAESIRQAMNLARKRYPGGTLKVMFPIDPDAFFVRDLAAEPGLLESELSKRMAG